MSTNTQSSSLLIIGGTKAGKSHYGGQLLRRLQSRKGELKMSGTPSDLTPFQEVLEKLALGRSAVHTPSGTYKESIWNVRSEDGALESQLVWPDYAGEQIENVVKLRKVTETWVQRIRESNGWLFFVRLSTINAPEDVLERPRVLDSMQVGLNAPTADVSANAEASSGKAPDGRPDQSDTASLRRVTLSTQAGLVELLQALLFIKQVGTNLQLRCPALVIALSCYDEIAAAKDEHWEYPADLLRTHLPLLSQYVESTWARGFVEVVGLSALGKPLSEDFGDDVFMEAGPERQGWCIKSDGTQTGDLTLPVSLLMHMTRSA